MTAEEVLQAMEKYGLTLRRLTDKDTQGRDRKPGWLVKVTGDNHHSMVQFILNSRFEAVNDFYGETPQEAVQKAIDSLKGKQQKLNI